MVGNATLMASEDDFGFTVLGRRDDGLELAHLDSMVIRVAQGYSRHETTIGDIDLCRGWNTYRCLAMR
jgi:hypothetical protein